MADRDPAETLRLRLYCHGLGDCSLIGVPKHDGETFWILIDCGIHTSAAGGKDRVRKVVEDISKITKRLDVIVGTHEHWDHLSGFTQAQDLFAQFEVGEVWFAWTENPADPQARQLDKFKSDAVAALVDTALRLDGDARFAAQAEAIDAMLGFVFGAAGELTRNAREQLRGLSPNVRHLEPGTVVPLPADVDAVRIHVLGPPRDSKLLGLMDSAAGTYHAAAGQAPLVGALRNGMAVADGGMRLVDDPLGPFEPRAGISLSQTLAEGGRNADPDSVAFLSLHYAGDAATEPKDKSPSAPLADQSWRRIDNDWLGVGADLALQLDSRTNNTSLVLAIEIVATGRVLVFAADAQIGNWTSWAGLRFDSGGAAPVTGADLLARTIFYKVGHHGSRNATLSEGGLELMASPDLSAFIPTDEVMAKKVGWKDIPATGLITRLKAKTGGRLIQSDADWIQKPGQAPGVSVGGSIRELDLAPALCVDLLVG